MPESSERVRTPAPADSQRWLARRALRPLLVLTSGEQQNAEPRCKRSAHGEAEDSDRTQRAEEQRGAWLLQLRAQPRALSHRPASARACRQRRGLACVQCIKPDRRRLQQRAIVRVNTGARGSRCSLHKCTADLPCAAALSVF